MNKKTIEDVAVSGRRVLLRADFNVPLDAQGRISDNRRLRAALPTIRSVLRRRGRAILMSHLGRPKTPEDRVRLSLRPVAEQLQGLLGSSVLFVGKVIGEDVQEQTRQLQDGQALMLENLRFHSGETEGALDLAQALAALGEIYCNDAFGAAHRADASLIALPKAMEGRPKVAGLLLAKEVRILTELMSGTERPFVAVLGGAKISDKIGLLRRLAEFCDGMLIGGAMANTFAVAKGGSIGKSAAEPALASLAREILEKAQDKIVLPIDVRCGSSLSPGDAAHVFAFGEVPEELAAYDIGPKAAEQFAQATRLARTIFWNGPLGVCEVPPFDAGTRIVAQAVVAVKARSVIGGGDTAAALDRLGFADSMYHVSTGGGASLALIAGERLKTVEILDED